MKNYTNKYLWRAQLFWSIFTWINQYQFLRDDWASRYQLFPASPEKLAWEINALKWQDFYRKYEMAQEQVSEKFYSERRFMGFSHLKYVIIKEILHPKVIYSRSCHSKPFYSGTQSKIMEHWGLNPIEFHCLDQKKNQKQKSTKSGVPKLRTT